MDGNCWNWSMHNLRRISLCIYFPAVSHAGINCLIFSDSPFCICLLMVYFVEVQNRIGSSPMSSSKLDKLGSKKKKVKHGRQSEQHSAHASRRWRTSKVDFSSTFGKYKILKVVAKYFTLSYQLYLEPRCMWSILWDSVFPWRQFSIYGAFFLYKNFLNTAYWLCSY